MGAEGVTGPVIGMTEHADADGFSPEDAARELQGLTAFEVGLRQRTEGINWALWGLVTAGIFLSYGLAGAMFRDAWPWWGNHLWVPWVVAGNAMSWALWRSAAITAPRAADFGARGWVHCLAWIGLIFGAWFLAAGLGVELLEPVFALMVVAWASLFVGATNVLGYTPAGRRVAVVAGVVMLAVAVAEAVLSVGYGAATVVGVLAGGLPWLVGGLYETLRG